MRTLLAALVLAGCADAAEPEPPIWGDVTGERVVDVGDAQQIARYSVGLAVVRPDLVARCGDVTGDGVVDVIDAQQVSRYTVGLPAADRIGRVCR